MQEGNNAPHFEDVTSAGRTPERISRNVDVARRVAKLQQEITAKACGRTGPAIPSGVGGPTVRDVNFDLGYIANSNGQHLEVGIYPLVEGKRVRFRAGRQPAHNSVVAAAYRDGVEVRDYLETQDAQIPDGKWDEKGAKSAYFAAEDGDLLKVNWTPDPADYRGVCTVAPLTTADIELMEAAYESISHALDRKDVRIVKSLYRRFTGKR